MCYGALGVGALMLLLFALDLIVGFPFGGGAFLVPDILGVISSGVVAFLGFNALQDVK